MNFIKFHNFTLYLDKPSTLPQLIDTISLNCARLLQTCLALAWCRHGPEPGQTVLISAGFSPWNSIGWKRRRAAQRTAPYTVIAINLQHPLSWQVRLKLVHSKLHTENHEQMSFKNSRENDKPILRVVLCCLVCILHCAQPKAVKIQQNKQEVSCLNSELILSSSVLMNHSFCIHLSQIDPALKLSDEIVHSAAQWKLQV